MEAPEIVPLLAISRPALDEVIPIPPGELMVPPALFVTLERDVL